MKPHDRSEWLWIGLLIAALAIQVALTVWPWIAKATGRG